MATVNNPNVFVRVHKRIAKMLQLNESNETSCTCRSLPSHQKEHDSALSFTTDTWTSPNSKAYVAVSVHFENNGVPVAMLLDIIEVAESHLCVNLALTFSGILDEFGISDKVS